MSSSRRYGLLALVIYLLLYILPLAGRPLFVPDETRYGEIPREMIAGHDWVVPHLDGLRYFEKPVMGYWLHAASLMLFGDNRFALRLPSALAVGLSALLLFFLGRRASAFGDDDPRPGLCALVFLTCFEVFGVGTFAVLDSLLAFFITAVMVFFFFATESVAGSARERVFLLLAGISCGLAFLTKGFLALALPVLVLLPYLLWQGRPLDLVRMAWPSLLAAVIVALPWSLAIHAREPGFWHYFFWTEHVRRFLAKDAQHGKPFWFFFAAAPLMFLPWSFVFPAALSGLGRRINSDDREGRLLRFSLCWLALPFLFFSVSHGKILTYILPCFPPFSILMVMGTGRGARPGVGRGVAWGARGLGGLFAVLALAFLVLQIHGWHGVYPYVRTWKWLMVVNSLALFVFFAILAGRQRRTRQRIVCLALAPLLFMVSIQFIVPDLTIEKKSPEPLLARHRRDITPGTLIISGEEPLTAACFVFGRDDIFILGGAGELAYGLGYADAGGRHLDPDQAAGLIAANPGRVVLTARARNYRRWRARLPPPLLLDDNGPQGYVFVRY